MEDFGREPAIHTQNLTCTFANFKLSITHFLTSKLSSTPRLYVEKSSLKYFALFTRGGPIMNGLHDTLSKLASWLLELTRPRDVQRDTSKRVIKTSFEDQEKGEKRDT